jgi:hypothetical protein
VRSNTVPVCIKDLNRPLGGPDRDQLVEIFKRGRIVIALVFNMKWKAG